MAQGLAVGDGLALSGQRLFTVSEQILISTGEQTELIIGVRLVFAVGVCARPRSRPPGRGHDCFPDPQSLVGREEPPLISGARHKAVRIGAAGAVFLALAAPFSAVPSALADPGHKSLSPPSHAYYVTLSCMLSDVSGATTPTGRGIKVAPAGGCSRAGPSILGSSIEARCTWDKRHLQRNPASESRHSVRVP